MAGACAAPAFARDRHDFDIRGGHLSDAIVSLGTQGGISIGLSDPTARTTIVRPLTGSLSIDAALRRLLDGTGFRAVRIDDGTYMVVAARTKRAAAAAVRITTQDDIVVTASKRNTRLRDFPGSITMLDTVTEGLDRQGSTGSQSIVDIIPALASTHLGPGRNKLIIRGIADSSFTGPSQAIVGQYLGDIRLNYNAPDPDLNLYDMASVEVLEGPQGTLYGAGSLGGIVRIVPTPVDLSAAAGSIAGGVGIVHHGGLSNDIAGMVNLPVRQDVIGLRAVAYRSVDGGYIRDDLRRLDHVNRSIRVGGRLNMLVDAGNGWTIDLGGAVQNLDIADGQYAERGLPRYTRRSAIAQPFDNDYRLGQLVITKTWREMTLLSATGIVRHDVGEQFDATAAGTSPPRVFRQDSGITLFSNENRLSRRKPDDSGWLIGTSFIANSERLTRHLGDLSAPPLITGVRNVVTQGAIYGEVSIRLAPRLLVTGGGRLAYSRLSGELVDGGRRGGEPDRREAEILPSIALSWRPLAGLTTFLRYQEGFRPGGLSVAAGSRGIESQRFHGDSVATFEAGARFHDPQRDRFAASIGLSYAHWEFIQADLVNRNGLPFTANIGNGRIFGFEANASWKMADALRMEAGLFLNDSELTRPDPGFQDALHGELPNVARLGARMSITYDRPLTGDWALSARGSVRYFGHSRLGVGSQLDFKQGDYADTAFTARVGTERFGLSADITNLFNAAKNRFALGNPFGVMSGRQITPQTPRTIRFGFDAHF